MNFLFGTQGTLYLVYISKCKHVEMSPIMSHLDDITLPRLIYLQKVNLTKTLPQKRKNGTDKFFGIQAHRIFCKYEP